MGQSEEWKRKSVERHEKDQSEERNCKRVWRRSPGTQMAMVCEKWRKSVGKYRRRSPETQMAMGREKRQGEDAKKRAGTQ